MDYSVAKKLTYDTIRDFANLQTLSDAQLEAKKISECGVCDPDGNKIPNQCGQLTTRLVGSFSVEGETLNLQNVCDYNNRTVKDFFQYVVNPRLTPATT